MNTRLRWVNRSWFLVVLFVVVSSPAARFSKGADASLRVGLVLDKGGKDDLSFNAAAYRGMTKFKNNSGSFFKHVEATDDNAFETLIRDFAKRDFDPIIAIGVSQEEAVKKIAGQFPNKHFIIVDGEADGPNIKSIVFEEHEGSFLVGAIAALTTQTAKVGFIGGMDIPLIRRFALGFSSGAQHINPKIKVVSNYVGITAEAWNNPVKAKELGVSQYNSGVDIIFAAAGASGTGVFDAAEEKKKFAIGVDSNQDGVKPGFILTSMVKQIDDAVYSSCQDFSNNKFKAGTVRLGLGKGVDYTVDSFNEKILKPEVRKRADEIKTQIISGKIKVPDYYAKRK